MVAKMIHKEERALGAAQLRVNELRRLIDERKSELAAERAQLKLPASSPNTQSGHDSANTGETDESLMDIGSGSGVDWRWRDQTTGYFELERSAVETPTTSLFNASDSSAAAIGMKEDRKQSAEGLRTKLQTPAVLVEDVIRETKFTHRSVFDLIGYLQVLQLSRQDMAPFPVFHDRGLDEVPQTFAPNMKAPCWRSDEQFPPSILDEIVAKAAARAKLKGRGGKGPSWVHNLHEQQQQQQQQQQHEQQQQRRRRQQQARQQQQPQQPQRQMWAGKSRRGLLEVELIRGWSRNQSDGGSSRNSSSSSSSSRTHRRQRWKKSNGSGLTAELERLLVGTGHEREEGAVGGKHEHGRRRRRLQQLSSMSPQHKRSPRAGGRPGSADADAGERLYTLPMYLRDNGVPQTVGLVCLPYFFLLGVPKSGTTALYEMIAAHPQVIHTKKEPHWWTRAPPTEPISRYVLENYFSASKQVHEAFSQDSRNQLVFGDASASTFWQLHHKFAGAGVNSSTASSSGTSGGGSKWSKAASSSNRSSQRITVPALLRAVLPNAKLMVVFRNPAERALSEYAYFIADPAAITADHFTAAVKAQVSEFNLCRAQVRAEVAASQVRHDSQEDSNHRRRRLTQQLNAVSGNGKTNDDVLECMYFRVPRRNVRKGFVRVAYGIYSRPLAFWWTVFPRQQLLVLRSDELRAHPKEVLREVIQHLDLRPLSEDALSSIASAPAKANSRAASRSQLKMPPKAKLILDEFYAPFNMELAVLTDDERFLWLEESSLAG